MFYTPTGLWNIQLYPTEINKKAADSKTVWIWILKYNVALNVSHLWFLYEQYL